MSCPQWDNCDKFKCHDEQVCLNGDFWAKYWGSKERAEKMATISKPQKVSTKGKRYKQNWKGICHYCERKLEGKLFSTRDHLIPIAQEGTNDPRNSVESCARCNGLKGNRTPDQFAIELGYWISEGKLRISKDTLITILVNTRKLILEIAPYRHELYKKVCDNPPKIPVLLERPVAPKEYPLKLDKPDKKVYVNEADKWWQEVYLSMYHTDPKMFHEKNKK